MSAMKMIFKLPNAAKYSLNQPKLIYRTYLKLLYTVKLKVFGAIGIVH